MMKRTKIALVAGAAALAMAGIGGGIAFAADSGPTTTTPTSPGATPSAPSSPHAHHGVRRSQGGAMEHGELTVRTKTGDRVIDVQRGQVSAVSATSVTVRSTDGFTATYTVGSASKVRVRKNASTIANVHTGDNVAVAATKSGNTNTLRRLTDAS
jgi:hypothetical protein